MAVVIRRFLCLDLPMAGLVIGYLGVFGGIWEIIEILLSIVYFDDYYEDKFNEQTSALQVKSSKTIFFIQAARGILVLMLGASLLDLFSSILLIKGTHKNSHRMLLPWLIIKGIALGILIPVCSLFFFVGIYAISNGQGSILLVNSILVMIITCLYSYLFMVIYSLYYFIRDESQKPNPIDSEALYSNSTVQYNKT